MSDSAHSAQTKPSRGAANMDKYLYCFGFDFMSSRPPSPSPLRPGEGCEFFLLTCLSLHVCAAHHTHVHLHACVFCKRTDILHE